MRGRTMQGRGLFRAAQCILLLQLVLHLVIGVSDLNRDLVEIHQWMNETEDPCEDLYQYSCGAWIENATIPESYGSYGQFDVIDNAIRLIIKGLLEDTSNGNAVCDQTGNTSTLDCIYTRSTEAIQKAKFFYQACMNEDVLDNGTFSLDQFHEVLDTLGHTDMEILKNMMLMGLMPIIDYQKGSRPDNYSREILWIVQGSFAVLSDDLLQQLNRSDSILNKTEEYYNLLKSELLQNQSMGDVKDVLDFEIELAKVHIPLLQMESNSTVMILSDLMAALPDLETFNLKDFLNSITSNVTFTNDTEVAVDDVDTLVSIFRLVNESRSNGTVRDYLLITFASTMQQYMSKRIRDLLDVLPTELKDSNKEGERFEVCLKTTDRYLPDPIGLMYAQKYFPESSKTRVLDIIKYCKMALQKKIENSTWMDAETANKTIKKINELLPLVGYPDYSNVEETYQGVTFKKDEYLKNAVEARKWLTAENFKKLMKAPKRDEFSGSPLRVNAMYAPLSNTFQLNAGIMRPPFCSDNFTMSMMFGGIGMVIGHEMGHAFDTMAYNQGGINIEGGFWGAVLGAQTSMKDLRRQIKKDVNSNTTMENYKNLTQCYVDIINHEEIALPPETEENDTDATEVDHTFPKMDENFTDANVVNDTVTTIGENVQAEFISDFLGLETAYLAYKLWESANGKEQRIDNFFSHDKLFFISASRLWCTKYSRETMIRDALMHDHPLASLRGKLPMAYFPKFAEVFNCSKTAKMNRAGTSKGCSSL